MNDEKVEKYDALLRAHDRLEKLCDQFEITNERSRKALQSIRREVADVRAGIRTNNPPLVVVDNSFYVIDEIAALALNEERPC